MQHAVRISSALALIAALSFGGAVPANAQLYRPSSAVPTLRTIPQLAGTWAITLTGDTGCGITTAYIIVTLNASGAGIGRNRSHTSGCGDPVASQPFHIVSLYSQGNGVAGLSCGPGCGFEFDIQVSRDSNEFSLVDVCPCNPNNYLEGTAIRL